MHGLGPPRVPNKTLTNWPEKPRAGGTLESIVNQATRSSVSLPRKPPPIADTGGAGDELVPWFDGHNKGSAAAAVSNTMTMDARVPCSNQNSHSNNDHRITARAQAPESVTVPGLGTCRGSRGGVIGSYTQVTSCSGAATQEENNAGGMVVPGKRGSRAVEAAAEAREWSRGADPSMSGTSATFGSQQVRMDSCEREFGFGFASTSMGSPENASSGRPSKKVTAADDHDSVCHSRLQASTLTNNDNNNIIIIVFIIQIPAYSYFFPDKQLKIFTICYVYNICFKNLILY